MDKRSCKEGVAIFNLPYKRRTKFSKENKFMVIGIEEKVKINSKEEISQLKGNHNT